MFLVDLLIDTEEIVAEVRVFQPVRSDTPERTYNQSVSSYRATWREDSRILRFDDINRERCIPSETVGRVGMKFQVRNRTRKPSYNIT